MLVTKSVFKLIFVLSNYQTCTFPLTVMRPIQEHQNNQPTHKKGIIKVHKFKIVVQPIGGYFLNYMIYTV